LKKLEPESAPPEVRVGQAVRVVGGAPGVNAIMIRDLPGGYTVIALANYDPPEAVSLGNEIVQDLRRISP
jgi:hypothetical protein